MHVSGACEGIQRPRAGREPELSCQPLTPFPPLPFFSTPGALIAEIAPQKAVYPVSFPTVSASTQPFIFREDKPILFCVCVPASKAAWLTS